ncbi:MAG TPA: threonine/serine dehydratase [Candidatus Saccharimonadales bacterium]|nr:threonine/serine dehydratase [Candidatus Saccharimonadales bacterium]
MSPLAETQKVEHLAQIRGAAVRINGHVRRTPLLRTDIATGLMVKPESLQRTGSFKARGAFNAVLSLLERDPGVAGVVTHSSGNHGQALACAAKSAGLPATIVVPEGVTPAKVAGIRSFGATVVSDGVNFDNRETIAEEIARTQRLWLVHPYDDWDVVHGAGTVGLEIIEDAPTPGAIVVPVGGGGQISGIALAVSVLSPGTAVIGVEPQGAADAADSLHSGALQSLDADPITLAEGVKSKSIGDRNFDVIVAGGLVRDIVTVSESELTDAVRVAWMRLKLAIEPTAALALAAYLTGKVPAGTAEHPTVLVLSGGNFDPAAVAALLTG